MAGAQKMPVVLSWIRHLPAVARRSRMVISESDEILAKRYGRLPRRRAPDWGPFVATALRAAAFRAAGPRWRAACRAWRASASRAAAPRDSRFSARPIARERTRDARGAHGSAGPVR